MKRINGLFLLLFCSGFVFSQNAMPDYWAVTNKFFSLYHFEPTGIEKLAITLKKEGWHVEVMDPTNEKVLSGQLFCSKQKGRYQVLENFLRATDEPVNEKALAYINASGYQPYGFARCPYYGYNGWDADIIRDFDNDNSLNDTLLEALARAHAAYASRYLWYQFGGASLGNDSLQRKLGRLELPGDARVKLFTQHISRAIALYQKVYDRNKNYETFVGNIGTKLFTETFHGYLQLLLCRRDKEAVQFLAQCRIPANDSIAAQNLLNSVGENGILFTYGDTDTYPLYFLQAKYNTRKDVAVVNTSLLGLASYVDFLKQTNYVQFSTLASDYGRKDFDYAFYFPLDDKTRSTRLADFIAAYKNLRREQTMVGDSVRVYHVQRLYMPFAKTTDAVKPDTLQIALRQFLPMNEYMLYDIVAANFDKRPIYFSDYYEEFPVQNLEISGIVLQLSRTTNSYLGIQPALASVQEHFIKTKYKTPFDKDTPRPQVPGFVVNKQVDLFLPLIKLTLQNGDKAAAAELIRQCIAPFGDYPPYTDRVDSLAPLLYENGFEAMGDKLVKSYMDFVVKLRNQKIYSAYFDDKRVAARFEELGAMLKKYNRSVGDLPKVN